MKPHATHYMTTEPTPGFADYCELCGLGEFDAPITDVCPLCLDGRPGEPLIAAAPSKIRWSKQGDFTSWLPCGALHAAAHPTQSRWNRFKDWLRHPFGRDLNDDALEIIEIEIPDGQGSKKD